MKPNMNHLSNEFSDDLRKLSYLIRDGKTKECYELIDKINMTYTDILLQVEVFYKNIKSRDGNNAT